MNHVFLCRIAFQHRTPLFPHSLHVPLLHLLFASSSSPMSHFQNPTRYSFSVLVPSYHGRSCCILRHVQRNSFSALDPSHEPVLTHTVSVIVRPPSSACPPGSPSFRFIFPTPSRRFSPRQIWQHLRRERESDANCENNTFLPPVPELFTPAQVAQRLRRAGEREQAPPSNADTVNVPSQISQ